MRRRANSKRKAPFSATFRRRIDATNRAETGAVADVLAWPGFILDNKFYPYKYFLIYSKVRAPSAGREARTAFDGRAMVRYFKIDAFAGDFTIGTHRDQS
jgi:hypothetical protein